MKYFLLLTALFIGTVIQAQPNKLSDLPGKVTGLPVNGAFKGVEGPASAVNEYNQTFIKILDALNASKTMKNPVGFEVALSASISQLQPQLGQKRYRGFMNVFLKAYRMGNAGFVKPEDHASSSIKIYLNDNDFFSRTAGFFKKYDDKYKIPHPFQKIPVTDSTPYYTEYSFRGYEFPTGYYPDFAFRVVTRSDKPVFIPFGRKQYLEYLIAVENLKKKDNETRLERNINDLAAAKKKFASATDEQMKKIHRATVEGAEDAIKLARTRIKQHEENISGYRMGILAMSDDEKQMTAYVDVSKSPHPNTERLAAPGRREGHPLYILNPDFYDDALAPTKTQSVIIAYWHGKQGVCPEYMQQNVKQIFENIDYKSIKESLR